jgi:mannose-6-phosphate isomerase-like protein (cupin superfamily)
VKEVIMARAVNIDDCFEMFRDTYSPKIVGELNGQHVKLVRLEGDKCPYHTHDMEDEMFYVLDGILNIEDESEKIEVRAGEFYIVRKNREHRVIPRGHVKLLLFEPEGIEHTGKVQAEITKKYYDKLDI